MKGSVSAPGKCILIGEHSVVRGFPALVFPLASKRLTLSWESSEGSGLEVDAGDYSEAFQRALALALKKLGVELSANRWMISIQSDIPVRAGLGSSAALSVCTVRFLQELGLHSGDLFPLALEIEDIFHGRSSGIDVAAVLGGRPLVFTKGEPPAPLTPAWSPKLYLFDSGLRSSTKACVEQVAALLRPDLDEKMSRLVTDAKNALTGRGGTAALAEAIKGAAGIFHEWGLVPAQVAAKSEELMRAGALAVKPTGSGNGGYLLSLWEKDPPGDLALIPLSADF